MSDTYVVSGSGATAKYTILKDPNAVLDYTFDWTDYLDDISDSIASKTMVPATGITVDSSSITGASKKVVAWVSGGTAGTTYALTCRIVTAGGRTDDRTVYVKVKDR